MDEWSKFLVIFYKLCSIYASYLNLCHTVPPLYSPINDGFGDSSSAVYETAFVIPVAPYSPDAIHKPLTQSQKTEGFALRILQPYLTKQGRVRKFFHCLYG